MTNSLFLETDNGNCYVLLDGGLRHVPNPSTLEALFTTDVLNGPRITFATAADAPFPIHTGFPIMVGAQLADTTNPSDGILLTDQYPWAHTTTVLRHVINPNQMTEVGFDWNQVSEYPAPYNFGVPLAVDSNQNYNAIKCLCGYYALYTAFILKGAMNPYFNYLLPQFPNPNKMIYKGVLKSLIIKYQNEVNNLPNS